MSDWDWEAALSREAKERAESAEARVEELEARVAQLEAALNQIVYTFEIDWHDAQVIASDALESA